MLSITTHDRTLLRELAKRLAEIAAQPVMAERKALWRKHNSLQRVRPMILVYPEGAWEELLPDSALRCENPDLRPWERNLRMRIYYWEHLHDDQVIEDLWTVGRGITVSGWGLEPKSHASTEQRGAWAFDPVVKGPADLKKLRYPEVTVDEAAARTELETAQELFGDILRIRQDGVGHVSFHLMARWTRLRGLDQVMMDMVDEPAMLNEAMAFLEAGYHRLIRRYQELGLLSLNNNNLYHSSGGNGWTDELPQPDFDGTHVRPADMWASAEAQELALVSPEMHEEFSLQYERRLLAPFGLNGYGCCEDLTRKLNYVLSIPNLRRVSISPFADVERCAETLGRRVIFSWKPHPSHLVGRFDADRVREYIRHTLEVTRGCVIEMILKDTHTCENHPERFTQWTDIAQELAAEY